MTKVWNQGGTVSEIVEKFTVGKDRELDVILAPYDVIGSIAHVKMLKEVELISDSDSEKLVKELESILEVTKSDGFSIPEGYEDIHSYVEFLLVEALGDIGKKVHTGRSRNDQVLVDLHLFVKAELREISNSTTMLFDQFISLGRKYEKLLMPGYTHMQVAMPSSFGLWFGAYAETLIDDLVMFNAVSTIADQNPLGSAAGYGSSFPLDRELTTKLLDFKQMKVNSIAAQLSRGKLEKSMAFAMASLAGTLSKFAMDVVLYSNQNFGFISFPDELTTGSSIMPHKRNPDVFELIRARCNKIQALPSEIMLLTNNLPSGYHRDFQLLKENLFNAISEIKECLEVCCFMLDHILIKDALIDDEKYKLLFTVEEVNRLVTEGASFRDAYHEVSVQVKQGTFERKEGLSHTHVGSIGNPGFDLIQKKLLELTI